MSKPKVKGRSSERIAESILKHQGYTILETSKVITVGNADAFEVDIIAVSPEGEKCCVEVKSGRAGVSDVRQVFANSEVLGLKPMLVCKGFADDAAEAVARELGVKMTGLSEHYILLEPEELEIIVGTAMRKILSEYGLYPMPPWEALKEEDWKVVESLARAENFEEAKRLLDLNGEELGKMLGHMRERRIFPNRGQSFSDLKKHSQQLLQRYFLVRRLEKIENKLEKLGNPG